MKQSNEFRDKTDDVRRHTNVNMNFISLTQNLIIEIITKEMCFHMNFRGNDLVFFLPLFLVPEKDDTDEEEVISVDIPPQFYFIC